MAKNTAEENEEQEEEGEYPKVFLTKHVRQGLTTPGGGRRTFWADTVVLSGMGGVCFSAVRVRANVAARCEVFSSSPALTTRSKRAGTAPRRICITMKHACAHA